jgi:hypothetical protein
MCQNIRKNNVFFETLDKNEPLGAKDHRWWEKKSARKTLAK